MDEIQQAQKMLRIGNALNRLLNNKDFKLVFQDIFHDEYMRTVGLNFSSAGSQSRERYAENIAARGIFIAFIEQLLNDARNAQDFIAFAAQHQVDTQTQTEGE